MRPINANPQDDQAVIQQEIGLALRLSFEATTRQPLPEQMALLLLRLALAEALGIKVEEDNREG